MKKLGVIILNWNGLELLKQFVPVASRFTVCATADLIVADNGSTDGSVEWLRQNHPEVKLIVLDKNYGFAEGYNRAVAQSDYPFVVLLNSDVEVTAGWWRPLLEFMESNPDVGAVQPKILSWSDRTRFEYAGAAGGYIDSLGYPYCRGRLFDATEVDHGQYDGAPHEIAWASGACLMTRKKLYERLGGLDSAFFAHMEEIDLCLRIRRAGYRVCCVTASSVYHVGGASLGADNPRKTYLNFRNNLLLLYKNMPRRQGRSLLLKRRLADTLAFLMFLAKGQTANARAVIRAHRDYRKMKGRYTELPDVNFFAELPGARRSALVARYLLRKKTLQP